MTTFTLELSRPLQVDRIPALGSHESVEATEAERASVAQRLDLPVIHSLRAKMHAKPWRRGMQLTGTVIADIEQVSVVSLEQFRTTIECPIERYFMPVRADGTASEEDD